ncbi:hypothetical protein AV530_006415 [Patagioenas fasciata monilis]|uniref:Uncharacterized protein n=1 Tax=Patagioenas fasciata monilis TaxID=372326 RepID=A0A1V4KGH5_PATFA|nr:hypothetical protein AV530_006415 [Patagioenas fasciata monilis]
MLIILVKEDFNSKNELYENDTLSIIILFSRYSDGEAVGYATGDCRAGHKEELRNDRMKQTRWTSSKKSHLEEINYRWPNFQTL